MKKLSLAVLIFLLSISTCFAGIKVSGLKVSGVNVQTGSLSGTTFDMTSSGNYYDIGYATSRGSYLESSAFSRGRFTTTATSISVTGYSNMFSLFSGYADIGMRVDGSDVIAFNFTGNGLQTFTQSMSAGTKTVEIISGAQTSNNTTNVYGSWPTSITFIGDASATKSAPTQSKRIVIYGDSISIGDDSTDPSLQAWPLLVRNAYSAINGSIIVEGFGYRSLHDDCVDATTCLAMATKLAAMYSGITTKILYIQVSTNDYGLNRWSAATFGTNYALLLDDLHALDATISVYAQTAIPRATETANGSGSTMSDYRTQVSTVCTARASYCTVVDGTAIFTYPTNYVDSVHPNLAGQTQYANYIKTLFSIP